MAYREFVALMLVLLFASPIPLPAQQAADRIASLKKAVIEIPSGSVVAVRMMDKQKLRGKLGAISDTGFELQTVNGGQIQTRSLQFDSVRSVKFQEKGMSTAAKITLGALAGVGVFFVILIAIAAAHGWD